MGDQCSLDLRFGHPSSLLDEWDGNNVVWSIAGERLGRTRHYYIIIENYLWYGGNQDMWLSLALLGTCRATVPWLVWIRTGLIIYGVLGDRDVKDLRNPEQPSENPRMGVIKNNMRCTTALRRDHILQNIANNIAFYDLV
jgi:hypothetical protein